MTRVYVDMVADLFHYGHANFLRQAKQFGDHLIVGIHSDEVVKEYKRSPVMTMKERMDTVSSCRYVDGVVEGCPLYTTQSFVTEHDIDLVVHAFKDVAEHDTQKQYFEDVNFKALPYHGDISTTDIIYKKTCNIDKY